MKKSSTFKNKKVLITGHTGFKGSWLSLLLNQLGAKVIGVSDYNFTSPSMYKVLNLKKFIKSYKIDICDFNKIESLIKNEQPDFIFHLAAQSLVHNSYSDPINNWRTNTLGTVSILNSLKTIKNRCNVVMITSDKSYKNLEWSWGYRENDQLGGADPYSASKGAAEFAIKSYVDSFYKNGNKIRIAVGRAGNVIGGGDWASNRIIPDCIRSWSENKHVILRNPKSTRPWQHVLEPLSGYITLAKSLNKSKKMHGEAFNFGPSADNEFSVEDLAYEMQKHWKNAKWIYKKNNYSNSEAGLLKLNCDKALNKLKWKASWSFEKTIYETIIWYDNYLNNRKYLYDLSVSQINNYISDFKKNTKNDIS